MKEDFPNRRLSFILADDKEFTFRETGSKIEVYDFGFRSFMDFCPLDSVLTFNPAGAESKLQAVTVRSSADSISGDDVESVASLARQADETVSHSYNLHGSIEFDIINAKRASIRRRSTSHLPLSGAKQQPDKQTSQLFNDVIDEDLDNSIDFEILREKTRRTELYTDPEHKTNGPLKKVKSAIEDFEC